MCLDEKTPEKRYASMLATGTASSVAKASPGIGVSALTFYGYSIETWISILTLCYLALMIVGSLPKVIEGLRYIYALARQIKKDERAKDETSD